METRGNKAEDKREHTGTGREQGDTRQEIRRKTALFHKKMGTRGNKAEDKYLI